MPVYPMGELPKAVYVGERGVVRDRVRVSAASRSLLARSIEPGYIHSVIAYSVGANASAPPAAMITARPISAITPSRSDR